MFCFSWSFRKPCVFSDEWTVVERGESVDLGSPTLTIPALLFQHKQQKCAWPPKVGGVCCHFKRGRDERERGKERRRKIQWERKATKREGFKEQDDPSSGFTCRIFKLPSSLSSFPSYSAIVWFLFLFLLLFFSCSVSILRTIWLIPPLFSVSRSVRFRCPPSFLPSLQNGIASFVQRHRGTGCWPRGSLKPNVTPAPVRPETCPHWAREPCSQSSELEWGLGRLRASDQAPDPLTPTLVSQDFLTNKDKNMHMHRFIKRNSHLTFQVNMNTLCLNNTADAHHVFLSLFEYHIIIQWTENNKQTMVVQKGSRVVKTNMILIH